MMQRSVYRVEGEHEGALVVLDAAADEPAVPARDLEGGEGPAQAQRHDVGVGDRGEVALRAGGAGHIGKSQVAVDVGHGEAQTLSHPFGLVEGVPGRRAPGLAGLRRGEVLHGLVAHQARDVGDDVLPDLVDVGVHLLLELLVYHVPSLGRAPPAPGSSAVHLSAPASFVPERRPA